MSVDGVNLTHRMIVRELSLFFLDTQTTRHYFFKRPLDLRMTHNDRQTERYSKQVLGGLGIDDHAEGSLDYYAHIRVIRSLQEYRIFLVGDVAEKFVNNILPYGDIWNLQNVSSFTYPKELPPANCGIPHNPRYCSLAKLWCVKAYMDNNPSDVE